MSPMSMASQASASQLLRGTLPQGMQLVLGLRLPTIFYYLHMIGLLSTETVTALSRNHLQDTHPVSDALELRGRMSIIGMLRTRTVFYLADLVAANLPCTTQSAPPFTNNNSMVGGRAGGSGTSSPHIQQQGQQGQGRGTGSSCAQSEGGQTALLRGTNHPVGQIPEVRWVRWFTDADQEISMQYEWRPSQAMDTWYVHDTVDDGTPVTLVKVLRAANRTRAEPAELRGDILTNGIAAATGTPPPHGYNGSALFPRYTNVKQVLLSAVLRAMDVLGHFTHPPNLPPLGEDPVTAACAISQQRLLMQNRPAMPTRVPDPSDPNDATAGTGLGADSGLSSFAAVLFVLVHAHGLPRDGADAPALPVTPFTGSIQDPHFLALPDPKLPELPRLGSESATFDLVSLTRLVRHLTQHPEVWGTGQQPVTPAKFSEELPAPFFFDLCGTPDDAPYKARLRYQRAQLQRGQQQQQTVSKNKSNNTNVPVAANGGLLPTPGPYAEFEFQWVLLFELLRTNALTYQPYTYINGMNVGMGNDDGQSTAHSGTSGHHRTGSARPSATSHAGAGPGGLPALNIDGDLDGDMDGADAVPETENSNDTDGYELPHVALMARIACLVPVALVPHATWDTALCDRRLTTFVCIARKMNTTLRALVEATAVRTLLDGSTRIVTAQEKVRASREYVLNATAERQQQQTSSSPSNGSPKLSPAGNNTNKNTLAGLSPQELLKAHPGIGITLAEIASVPHALPFGDVPECVGGLVFRDFFTCEGFTPQWEAEYGLLADLRGVIEKMLLFINGALWLILVGVDALASDDLRETAQLARRAIVLRAKQWREYTAANPLPSAAPSHAKRH